MILDTIQAYLAVFAEEIKPHLRDNIGLDFTIYFCETEGDVVKIEFVPLEKQNVKICNKNYKEIKEVLTFLEQNFFQGEGKVEFRATNLLIDQQRILLVKAKEHQIWATEAVKKDVGRIIDKPVSNLYNFFSVWDNIQIIENAKSKGSNKQSTPKNVKNKNTQKTTTRKAELARYIPKKSDEAVKKSSGFKCAWDGAYLLERHHIQEYHLGGTHDPDNLILLCPNCHTKAHNGEISEIELINRRKELSGKVDRSSGNLSISSSIPLIVGKGILYDTENIIKYEDTILLKQEIHNGILQISLKLFDKNGFLICWMSKNHWWVENNSIFDFHHSKKIFWVKEKINDSFVKFELDEDKITLSGRMYINGYSFEFSDNGFEYAGRGESTGDFKMTVAPNNGEYMVWKKLKNVFNFTSEEGPLFGFGGDDFVRIDIGAEMWKNPIDQETMDTE